MVGAGVPVNPAISTTATISASTSVDFPSSISWSVEGLCLPTLAAPCILFSTVMGKVIPRALAMATASSMAERTKSTDGGNVAITSSVECAKAPSGLKQRFPRSFTHKFVRIESKMGALNPAFSKMALMVWTLGVILPSNSPKGRSLPSVCVTSPGARKCAAGYGMQPTMRLVSMALRICPLGSTLSKARPSNWPPWPTKYHHGRPFCMVMTTVSSWKSLGRSSKTGRI
mmetsp:Transcript_18268/g.27575  ORF Transcript_18268/g.27575 Transcript_18268/m.27575 type:complete len:229 (-) Transcript_18268:82-768(-)